MCQGPDGGALPIASKKINSNSNMNDLGNEFTPSNHQMRPHPWPQMNFNLLRNLKAVALSKATHGFLKPQQLIDNKCLLISNNVFLWE